MRASVFSQRVPKLAYLARYNFIIMRGIASITLLLSAVCVAFAAETQKTVDVFAWPFSSAKPQQFAKVSYRYPSLNATVQLHSLPKTSDNQELVRIGFYRSTDAWSGIATSAQSFGTDREKRLRLIVDSDGDPYHIGFSGMPISSPADRQGYSNVGDGNPDQVLVEVVRQSPGPLPHLNKPVVLSPEGKVEDKEPEKSFFQKYDIKYPQSPQ